MKEQIVLPMAGFKGAKFDCCPGRLVKFKSPHYLERFSEIANNEYIRPISSNSSLRKGA